jgi:hypothetical protein
MEREQNRRRLHDFGKQKFLRRKVLYLPHTVSKKLLLIDTNTATQLAENVLDY